MLTKEKIIDIRENTIDAEILDVLLKDRSTGQNIMWCTDDYSELGTGYGFNDTIEAALITGNNDGVIKPRTQKDKTAQEQRSKTKAEVFTPSWVCNAQNNLVDDAWFGVKRSRFNTEKNKTWITNYYPVYFPKVENKSWRDYVQATRMEVSCGEAPYLTSRYDTVSGNYISVRSRIGMLDRKLRIITENVSDSEEWKNWAVIALQNVYGYDWQGDNVLLARENVLYSVIEAYYEVYSEELGKEWIKGLANIISWNIWQMDGIKCVVPESCRRAAMVQLSFFDEEEHSMECPGCKSKNHRIHTGIYCRIMDWDTKETVRFIDLMKGAR